MTYELHRLAPGSYDLLLNGSIIGSVVQEITPSGHKKGWSAELLDDSSPERRPSPFIAAEHPFQSLDAVTAWLGGAAIVESAYA
ncbi:hypothetical protein HCU64_24820 [Methylobacterium sp. C25]|uniref:hypothetical protein n=1 Tax=Methylobacterium sp. C25 TaxID=2721622 RepID=UPI001F2D2E64|nr:hypothetical protein [Methylobacterium sp. C25]MCE4226965.1 hypothetical protein [Methylobacterium sp. C25]